MVLFRNSFFYLNVFHGRSSIHDYDTRSANLIEVERTRTVMAANFIRNHLPAVMITNPRSTLDNINTHCLKVITFYIKRFHFN